MLKIKLEIMRNKMMMKMFRMKRKKTMVPKTLEIKELMKQMTITIAKRKSSLQ